MTRLKDDRASIKVKHETRRMINAAAAMKGMTTTAYLEFVADALYKASLLDASLDAGIDKAKAVGRRKPAKL